MVERGTSRLRLSAHHTVVGIAGATGSGKSSTFNALTGLELSAVGVRRPTTSWATACVWGTEGAGELLEWLGIPPRHQTTRDSMLDTRRESNALEGVVLLDLPDHDSTEVAHHLEVDRLVALADMFVWVLDPQKYADAAIHDRYLAPMRTHADVMVVVLNHIDTVPEDRRDAMVDDVRRLLAADGIPDVPVIPISARHGIGIDQLKGEIEKRVADKRMTAGRIEADVRAAAAELRAAAGDAPTRTLSDERVEALRADRARLRTELAAAATVLSDLRTDAARRLGEQVSDELTLLAMPHATLSVAVRQHETDAPQDADAPGVPLQVGERWVRFAPSGIDEVELLLAANTGSDPRPLDKGASGGELSRVMLAVEVALAGTSPVPTFVFDEVDAGVGGAAAVEVGRRLAELARTSQVLVVTHLPQVAAYADRHVVVRKSHDGTITSSGLTLLGEEEREHELSRMMAGLTGSDTALAHARELLEVARTARA